MQEPDANAADETEVIFDAKAAEELEAKYDSGLVTRPIGSGLAKVVFVFSLCFAFYHYFTAGYRTPVDFWHMGNHLTGLFFLIYVGFPAWKKARDLQLEPNTWWRWSNVPIYDWALAAAGTFAGLWIGISWNGIEFEFMGYAVELNHQVLRQGDPDTIDIILGTILIFTVLDIARRTIGWVLPGIITVFICYALFGPYIPVQILKHPGVPWSLFVNNIYFPSEGIFGVTLWVVSTVVFHFVLFGVIAQRMGLGQFFVDFARVLAGRYVGGPAKVSVVSSAFFGTISGSSIANTVSTGSLTIPNMKRMGYPGHFAGGVEAAASAGGQITPPIMGAAAFLMAEYLEMPYTQIIIAASVPALMHYVGVLSIVHFKAKKLGLMGIPSDQIPKMLAVWKNGWPTVIPLAILIYVLFAGYSPFMAAFWGITACIVVGFINPMHRMSLWDLMDASVTAVRYALAVGAACAAVGIVVGVITATGLAFRLGFMVTNGAAQLSETFHAGMAFLPFELFTIPQMSLFLSLVFVAIACISMGAGLPTTALYIMLVSVAQPALAQLGVPALASHLFVLYYGVISEITPPVCASAYAAAGIAGSNPFRTGVSAFSLGIAKLLVPMVFVYSPAMLIILDDYFTWQDFIFTVGTCIIGIMMLATGVTGYAVRNITWPFRMLLMMGGVMMVAPNVEANLWALVLVVPAAIQQFFAWRRMPIEDIPKVIPSDLMESADD
jgi:TRAP transporter 4TM/12TM fusion protein